MQQGNIYLKTQTSLPGKIAGTQIQKKSLQRTKQFEVRTLKWKDLA